MLKVEATGGADFPLWVWSVPCLVLAVLFFFGAAAKFWLYFTTRQSSYPSPWSLPTAAMFAGAGFVHLLTYFTPAGVNAFAFLAVYWLTAAVGVFGVVGLFRNVMWLSEYKDKTAAEIAEMEKRLAALVEAERLMKCGTHNLPGAKSNVVG